MSDRIVAVALVTASELERLGEGFTRAFPLAQTGGFEDLLLAIDEADRALRDSPPATDPPANEH